MLYGERGLHDEPVALLVRVIINLYAFFLSAAVVEVFTVFGFVNFVNFIIAQWFSSFLT